MKRSICIVCSALAAWPLAGCLHMDNPLALLVAGRSAHDETQLQVARLQEHQGHLGKAAELYADLLKRNPEHPQACHRLAIVATRQGDQLQAVEYFQKALALNPHDAEVLADMGYALFLQGELESAEQTLRQALWEDAEHQRAANNLALVLGHQGHYDAAFQVYRQTLSEAEAHSNLAYIHTQQGHGTKAVEHYSRALELDPQLEAAQNGLLQIAKLKDRLYDDARARPFGQPERQTSAVAQVNYQALQNGSADGHSPQDRPGQAQLVQALYNQRRHPFRSASTRTADEVEQAGLFHNSATNIGTGGTVGSERANAAFAAAGRSAANIAGGDLKPAGADAAPQAPSRSAAQPVREPNAETASLAAGSPPVASPRQAAVPSDSRSGQPGSGNVRIVDPVGGEHPWAQAE